MNALGIVTVQHNGASSLVNVNAGTDTTGNAGAGNPGGLSLFSDNGGLNLANYMVAQWIIRANADAAAYRLAVQTQLNRIHSVY